MTPPMSPAQRRRYNQPPRVAARRRRNLAVEALRVLRELGGT